MNAGNGAPCWKAATAPETLLNQGFLRLGQGVVDHEMDHLSKQTDAPWDGRAASAAPLIQAAFRLSALERSLKGTEEFCFHRAELLSAFRKGVIHRGVNIPGARQFYPASF